ncbi:TPA: hypothetical protein QEM39_001939 [Pseudomonas putida]|uniref:hypothetical protein n=1 Tax=Pseudomonas TaxID=286 RepID=UPI000A084F99|nr:MULTISPECIES: hypothetical protein [Pseudomonas]MDD2151201.1 hypothetical protein [Pseudomonas putida]RAS21128.1 hypothetical protein H040_05006 [Pseudomonas sp. URMO17WK12:I7]SMF59343.1 hypothetical protein SAMN02745903_04471 [Pseudomonas sp. URMO17WK12:I5]HDS1680417.1 hypothetical protein [Pseudomonas putida]
MRRPPAARQEDLLPAPTIENRNSYDEIDLKELGDEALVTYIQYDGIAVGDKIRIYWRGATAEGSALETVGTEIEVEEPEFDPAKQRLRVHIANHYLSQADQGYAFYHYERVSGTPASSLRTFSFIGVRPHRMEHMPVAQAVESHALHIDPDALGSSGVMFVAPPYAAMRAGDTVTLVLRGYKANGALDKEYAYRLEVEEDRVGHSLAWLVPKGPFNFIKKGHAEVHYEIAFSHHNEGVDGPVQTYRIDAIPADPALLPAVDIVGYTGGPLDPERFPDGLTVQVPPYPALNTADWTLLHVNDEPGAAALRADLTTLATGVQGVHLDAQVLKGAKQLTLGYQVAREGLGLAGQLLDIEVLQPRTFLPVLVLDGETEPPEPNMWLAAEQATAGATVVVPDPDLRAGERLQLVWQGRSQAGQYEQTLVEGSVPPYRFTVPPTAVAANMEATESATAKRFPVFFRLLRDNLPPLESPLVQLRVLPLARTRYPTIQCDEASGTTLSLAAVPSAGATLRLPAWAFMAIGQRLNVVYRGVKKNGSALVELLRSEFASEEEVRNREVVVKLDKGILGEQKLGGNFLLDVKVNFENTGQDDTWFDFPGLDLTLNP